MARWLTINAGFNCLTPRVIIQSANWTHRESFNQAIGSMPSFLAAAVDFANETLWGNLTATLIIHPASLQDIQVAAAVDRAVTDLRYGMVLINQFAGLGYFAKTTTWGAYPGNDIYDIQSGIGVTSNVLMFAHPQKSVVRCPFKLTFDPLALQSRTALEICRRLADLLYRPAIWKVPGLIWSALRS